MRLEIEDGVFLVNRIVLSERNILELANEGLAGLEYGHAPRMFKVILERRRIRGQLASAEKHYGLGQTVEDRRAALEG